MKVRLIPRPSIRARTFIGRLMKPLCDLAGAMQRQLCDGVPVAVGAIDWIGSRGLGFR
jgi:hypothetical protein